MASFADEIKEATKALQAFAGAARSASSDSGGVGSSRPNRPAGTSQPQSNAGGAVLGLASSAAQFFTPAANAYAITGSSAGLSDSLSAGALDAFRKTGIGGFALALAGGSAALDTTARAGAATADITTDLARIGINVSPEQRRGLFNANLEQEKRVQREQAEVTKLSTDLDAIEGARPEGAGKGFDAMIAVLWAIQQAVEKIAGLTGGGR